MTTTEFMRLPSFVHLAKTTRTVRYFNGRRYETTQQTGYFAQDASGVAGGIKGLNFTKPHLFVHVQTSRCGSKMIRASFPGYVFTDRPNPELAAYDALYPTDDDQAVPF
jgi:hypothetical protein